MDKYTAYGGTSQHAAATRQVLTRKRMADFVQAKKRDVSNKKLLVWYVTSQQFNE